ncbi:uncharacterized protein LOC133914250 [Phragmites australis]|uniref:uncharacterized protein LOC133914250 n=1 Tax=Phragmites australis TaxID=29695 RepID=UPI002D787717|nr:uncharacterized protein LOC133914250 [Phragmites australis]
MTRNPTPRPHRLFPTPSLSLQEKGRLRERATPPERRVLESDVLNAAVHRCLQGVSDSKKGLIHSLWAPMERKGPAALTATELNAAVYRYFQESGFVHTAFNFFNEAGLGKADIEKMKIPPGALVRVVLKGLQYIELEANSEIENDDEYHFFDTLDLITNDSDELKRKITSSVKPNSVEKDKEQKTDSVKTDKAQNIDSAETATICRTPPVMQQVKAQGADAKKQKISSAEKAQKTQSVETTTRQRWQIRWIAKKLRTQKTKARKADTAQNSKSGDTAIICRTPPLMRQVKAQGAEAKKQKISSAETAQTTESAETTTGQRWQIQPITKKLRSQKTKARK